VTWSAINDGDRLLQHLRGRPAHRHRTWQPLLPHPLGLWDEADAVVTCLLTYVEATAALAQAQRLGRITTTQLAAARDLLDRLWPEFDIIDVDHALIRTAADLGRRQAHEVGRLLAAATADDLALGHAVRCAQQRCWPLISGDVDAARRLDGTVEVHELP